MLIDGKELNWILVTNHYDVHLAGIALHRGQLYKVRRVSPWGNWLNSDYDDERDDGPDNNPYCDPYEDNYEAAPVTWATTFYYKFIYPLFR